jgi:hypothetical protein
VNQAVTNRSRLFPRLIGGIALSLALVAPTASFAQEAEPVIEREPYECITAHFWEEENPPHVYACDPAPDGSVDVLDNFSDVGIQALIDNGIEVAGAQTPRYLCELGEAVDNDVDDGISFAGPLQVCRVAGQ